MSPFISFYLTRADGFAERVKSVDDVRRRVERCRRELTAAIEPNFGLVEELVSCRALRGDEREEVRAARTRSKRCRKLLKFILGKSDDDDDDDVACRRLLNALDRSDQRHVVNFVLHDAGTVQPPYWVGAAPQKLYVFNIPYLWNRSR